MSSEMPIPNPPKVSWVNLESLAELAPRLRADDWRSPLARRLSGKPLYADAERVVTDSYRGRDLATSEGTIGVRWKGLKDDFARCVNSYQEPDLTAFAALGLSCILVRSRTDLEITEVTRRGERADYWLALQR